MNAKRFLNGFVLVFLVTLGILCLPPVRTRVEKTLYPCKYSALVEQYAAEYDLDPLLVYSFVRTESGFDPDATSSVKADIFSPAFSMAGMMFLPKSLLESASFSSAMR